MNRREIKLLRERWLDCDIDSITSDFVRIFNEDPRKTSIDRSTFEKKVSMLDGYHDFRGFPLERILHVKDSKLDFSYSKSRLNIHGAPSNIDLQLCELTDCLFTHAQRFYWVTGKFARCKFDEANFREAEISGEFVDCTFTGANMQALNMTESVFNNCDFLGVNFQSSNLGESSFINCNFKGCKFGKGSMLGTKFRTCDFSGIDFKDTFRNEDTDFDRSCEMKGTKFNPVRKMFGIEIPTSDEDKKTFWSKLFSFTK